MNTLTIAGRVGKDSVLRHTATGKSVLGFSVAVDVRKGGEKETLWVDCSLWGERGEKLAEYVTKGAALCVTGEAGVREHNGKAYLTLNVRELTLLGGGDQAQRGGGSPSGRQRTRAESDAPADAMPDDDIPFISNRGTF